jgi:hypothetical protein
MTALTLASALSSAGTWMLNLATRMLSLALNMPEPLVYGAGVFVVAQVQAAENRAAKTLCPLRLLRQFWARHHQAR